MSNTPDDEAPAATLIDRAVRGNLTENEDDRP